MAINQRQIDELKRRSEITTEDVAEFLRDPKKWRDPPAGSFTRENPQAFWQSVYDELFGTGRVMVPTPPKLTPKQVKSFNKFGFILVYVPVISEENYPACFVKPEWGKYFNVALITRRPRVGKWVAVEAIAKPHYNDRAGYANDRLMVAVGKTTRFNTSCDGLTNGLLAEIAKVTGFPKKGTRLPTAEEWNFIGNLFNWTREHRSMNLPDLGSTSASEWCENAFDYGGRWVFVGNSNHGGLAEVNRDWDEDSSPYIAFRVLVDL